MENLIQRLDTAELFCRNRAKAIPQFNDYDVMLLNDASDAIQDAISALQVQDSKGADFDQIKNDPLTVEQLQKRKSPVWCRVDDCSWIPDGGYWCLCNEGVIVAPSGQIFKCEAIQNWKLYDHRPEVQQ